MLASYPSKLSLLLIALVFINANWKTEANPGIVWNETEHQFGEIKQGDIVETTFILTNTTKDTLLIENVQGSCGCVVGKWPTRPILPSDSAGIQVKFDSKGKTGKQTKSLTVYTSMGAYYLALTANVQKQKD